jgi:hypothetical protein
LGIEKGITSSLQEVSGARSEKSKNRSRKIKGQVISSTLGKE